MAVKTEEDKAQRRQEEAIKKLNAEEEASLEEERDSLRKAVAGLTKEVREYEERLEQVFQQKRYYEQQLALVAPYLASYAKRLEDENVELSRRLRASAHQHS